MTSFEEVTKQRQQWMSQYKMAQQGLNIEDGKMAQTLSQIRDIAVHEVQMKPKITGQNGDNCCPVCLDVFKEPSIGSCGHVMCKNCISQLMRFQSKCPVCRKEIHEVKQIYGINIVSEEQFGDAESKRFDETQVETKLLQLQKRLQIAQSACLEADNMSQKFRQINDQYLKSKSLLQQQIDKLQHQMNQIEFDFASQKSQVMKAVERKATLQEVVESLQLEIKKLLVMRNAKQ